MDFIASIATKFESQMIQTRRLLHAHPESGFMTYFATSFIANELDKMGFNLHLGSQAIDISKRTNENEAIHEVFYKKAEKLLNEEQKRFLPLLKGGLTGLVAEIDTKKVGKLKVFRFDIDCVETSESDEDDHLPKRYNFCSDTKGLNHACGHDGHTAIGLAFAKAISENLDKLNGKIRLIFQSAEESVRGAVCMEKAVENADFLFGLHLGIKAKKTGGIICGTKKFLASNKFNVILKGRSAHAAASPQNGANALLCACSIVQNLYAISRHSDGATRINVGKLQAGEARNVIAPNAILECETRGDTTELNAYMYEKSLDIIKGACKMHDVSYEIKQIASVCGGDSDEKSEEIFYKASLKSPFVDDELIEKNGEFSACEDFAHLMNIVQRSGGVSGFAMIGSNLSADHHNAKFDFDEKSLIVGLDVLLRVLFEL